MVSHPGFEGRRDDTSPPDEALLAAVGRGNEAALKSLYDRYGALVYTIALRIVGDRELAQEVLQDVFFRCWERAETFSPARGHVAGWLLRIARNRAIDVLRSGQHQARLRERELYILDGTVTDPGEADPLEQLALRHAVKAALEALPVVQRRTIELAFYGGFTQAEIAEVTATPLGTVKTRIRDGMHSLRSLLQPLNELPHEVKGRHE